MFQYYVPAHFTGNQLKVLGLFKTAPESGLSYTEIAELVKIPPRTVAYVLRTLLDLRYLEQRVGRGPWYLTEAGARELKALDSIKELEGAKAERVKAFVETVPETEVDWEEAFKNGLDFEMAGKYLWITRREDYKTRKASGIKTADWNLRNWEGLPDEYRELYCRWARALYNAGHSAGRRGLSKID